MIWLLVGALTLSAFSGALLVADWLGRIDYSEPAPRPVVMSTARGLMAVYSIMIAVALFHGLVLAPSINDLLNWLN